MFSQGSNKQKDNERRSIAMHVKAFLRNNGVIQKIAPSVTKGNPDGVVVVKAKASQVKAVESNFTLIA